MLLVCVSSLILYTHFSKEEQKFIPRHQAQGVWSCKCYQVIHSIIHSTLTKHLLNG